MKDTQPNISGFTVCICLQGSIVQHINQKQLQGDTIQFFLAKKCGNYLHTQNKNHGTPKNPGGLLRSDFPFNIFGGFQHLETWVILKVPADWVVGFGRIFLEPRSPRKRDRFVAGKEPTCLAGP